MESSSFNGFPGSINQTRLTNQSFTLLPLPNPNLMTIPGHENTYSGHGYRDFHYSPDDPTPGTVLAPKSDLIHEEDLPEDCDFSDTVLRYINQMLMEEDMEDKACMLQESLDLQAAERSLYEAIGKKYPPSPEPNLAYANGNSETLIHDFPDNYSKNVISGRYSGEYNSLESLADFKFYPPNLHSLPASLSSISQSSYSSSSGIISFTNGSDESPNSSLHTLPESNGDKGSVWLFRRGAEEASKFLPSEKGLLVNFQSNRSLIQNRTEEREKEEKETRHSINGFRGRKNPNREETDMEEERSSKMAAVFPDPILRSDMADRILVHIRGEDSMREFEELRDQLRNGIKKNIPQGGRRTKGGGKKQNRKKEVVDLRTLLINCAQAVAADDRRSATELMKQIKQHSSPYGDGNQRLAFCFVRGLEARLAGTGSQVYKSLVSKTISAADILQAYHLSLACCPFRKLSNFVANKTIKNLAANSMRVHVIDFGILYGFQWPTFIQRLSMLKGGPPKLRITGIEFPQPGFRPAQRVEETGKRLADYCKEFHVPFEYTAIAKRWDAVQLEELNIYRDEVLVVNCLYRATNLHDETVTAKSSRDVVLNLARKINPDLFIHGILNGAYNAPFFVTRFKEALFHFSSIFDMLETIVPSEDQRRMLLETEVFGREALNVIACEGWERIERPETYKQWQVRTMRAGFVQVHFESSLVKDAMRRVSAGYHKDFVIDEDSRWLLQGWKGRIVMALSAWKPDSKA